MGLSSRVLLATGFLGAQTLMTDASVEAQTSRSWIAETTVTWGRGGFAEQGFGTDAVALGDIGLRWTRPSGVGAGVSFAGGYDFPNEASLVGARGRVFREWGERRLEGSMAVLASSVDEGYVGASVGAAFYPIPLVAAVLQLDLLPTFPKEAEFVDPSEQTEVVNRDPTISFGLRLADEAGIVSWAAAGVLAAVVLASFWVLD